MLTHRTPSQARHAASRTSPAATPARGATLIVWTIQREAAWRELQIRGELTGREELVGEGFLEPYRWMMGQMARRMPGYRGNYPIWVWVWPKPDLRSSWLLPKGERGVRRTLKVDPARVLVSDFMAWHEVLNTSYLPLSDEEWNWWTSVTPPGPTDVGTLTPEVRAAMERSWERIFDLVALAASEWATDGSPRHQGVIERSSREDVARVEPFVAR